MPTLKYQGVSYDCATAIKGPDYIHLLDKNGVMVAAFDNITNFSSFTLENGSYTSPTADNNCYLAVIRDDGTFGKGDHKCSDIPQTAADVGAIPYVNAESADYDMDAIIKSGVHCAAYSTNGNTLGTPAAYGIVPSTFKRAMIISYSGVNKYGFQIAYPNGLPYMLIRNYNNGTLEAWTKIYSEGNKPTAEDVGAVPTTRNVNGYTLSADVNLTAADIGSIPMVVATSASDDMDALLQQGTHLTLYKTGTNTLGTPFKAGLTIREYATILSYATSTSRGMQIAFCSGSDVICTRKLDGAGKVGAWGVLYTANNKPTASEIGAYSLNELATTLAEGTDLDTIITAGQYRVENGTNAAKLVNAPPVSSGFKLIVEIGYSGTAHIYQTAIATDSAIWKRERFDKNWDEWRRSYDTVNKPTAADVAALALDGSGTMSGDIKIQKITPRLIMANGSTGTEIRVSNIDGAAAVQAKESADASVFRQLRLHSTRSAKAPAGSVKDVLQIYSTVSGEGTQTVLHTGNITESGVAKIEAGSYVGSGFNGEEYPTEITFSFVPKVVWVWRSAGGHGSPGMGSLNKGYMIMCSTLTNQYKGAEYLPGVNNTWYNKLDGTTLSFYYGKKTWDEEEEVYYYPDSSEQLNYGGYTYSYIAIG